jgi:hypothetical protein
MSNQKRSRYLVIPVLAPIILLIFVFTVLAAPSATTHTVCASGCDFSSIQAAINAALSGDTISLAGETFTESFNIDGKTLTVQGAGSDQTFLQAANTPGIASDRVIAIYAAAKVTLTGVTVRHGVAPDPGSGFASIGGGIYNVGELTLTQSIVTYNEADNGGGIFSSKSPDDPDSKGLYVLDSTISTNNSIYGGGIYNFAGSTTVQNSTISDNHAVHGSGIYSKSDGGHDRSLVMISNSTISGNHGSGWGGGINNNSSSTMNVDKSTIEDNSAGTGGGIYNYSTINIMNSTIYSNTGIALAGGLYNKGTVAITNTTITQNYGSALGGGISNWGRATVVNCTIVGNSTGESYGGGIYNTEVFGLKLSNSILADNYPSEADCEDIDGKLVDLGYNLVQDGSCISDPTSFADDPGIGPLQDNGGDTNTHALLDGSPAIDAIPTGMCVVTEDQRGIIRPQGNGCDTGAFEFLSSYDIFLPLVVR